MRPKSADVTVWLYSRSSYIGLLKRLNASRRSWNRTLLVIGVVFERFTSTCQ